MARRRKVRFSGRFYLTMLVLLGIVVALVLIIPSGGGGTLKNATMEAKLMPETVRHSFHNPVFGSPPSSECAPYALQIQPRSTPAE